MNWIHKTFLWEHFDLNFFPETIGMQIWDSPQKYKPFPKSIQETLKDARNENFLRCLEDFFF